MSRFKKIASGFALSFLVVGVFSFTLLSQTSKNEEVNTEYVIAGLMACLSINTCNVPGDIQDFEGTQVVGVYLKMPEKGINIKYSFINGGLSVVVIKDNANQISISDLDLNGLVDTAFATENGIGHYMDDPKYNDTIWDTQLLYMSALTRAWERVIPEDIKKALLENPEKGEKEEVPAKKKPSVSSKYST